jgi:hypothetical protein
MTKIENWIDETFDELSSRGASCSKSFSDELEKRLMKEHTGVPVRNRRAAWTIALVLLTAGIAGGAYANSDAIREWIYGPFYSDSEGTIRNEDGEMVGEIRQREDGTMDMSIELDNARIVVQGENMDLPSGPFSFTFEPSDEASLEGPVTEATEVKQK